MQQFCPKSNETWALTVIGRPKWEIEVDYFLLSVLFFLGGVVALSNWAVLKFVLV